MKVSVYFKVDKYSSTDCVSMDGVKYTSYSGNWYSITLANKNTHRWPSERILSIVEDRS